MKYNSQKHHRRSIRLKEYDYSQPGGYFVTVCTQGHEHLFGEILDGEIKLNRYGEIVKECWHDLPNHYPCVKLDEFVVMPNHVHGIIIIMATVGAGLRPAPQVWTFILCKKNNVVASDLAIGIK
jgi:putative transposase